MYVHHTEEMMLMDCRRQRQCCLLLYLCIDVISFCIIGNKVAVQKRADATRGAARENDISGVLHSKLISRGIQNRVDDEMSLKISRNIAVE